MTEGKTHLPPLLTADHQARAREPLLPPQVGDRVTCTLEPDPQDTGTVAATSRQTHTDDLFSMDWDNRPKDHDWYMTSALTVVERAR